uniref:hypothetical protein n=1 Tax=Edaphosphingomonas laterariae TaxID=861865 RepID=UPI001FEA2E61|nr:hypothetical protein [Sphingomonas laterariae]
MFGEVKGTRGQMLSFMITSMLRGCVMSVEGKIKEAAGYVKEEANEHGNSPEAKRRAQEGRDLRNEGRIEDGKAPKTAPPGSGSK